MLLPNGKHAVVDIRKLRDYCLNPDSPRGSRKAQVFSDVLGMTRRDAAMLRTRLLGIAATGQAQVRKLDEYGQRYSIDFEMQIGNRKAVLRSGWIVLKDEANPRLTTCYVKKRKRS